MNYQTRLLLESSEGEKVPMAPIVPKLEKLLKAAIAFSKKGDPALSWPVLLPSFDDRMVFVWQAARELEISGGYDTTPHTKPQLARTADELYIPYWGRMLGLIPHKIIREYPDGKTVEGFYPYLANIYHLDYGMPENDAIKAWARAAYTSHIAHQAGVRYASLIAFDGDKTKAAMFETLPFANRLTAKDQSATDIPVSVVRHIYHVTHSWEQFAMVYTAIVTAAAEWSWRGFKRAGKPEIGFLLCRIVPRLTSRGAKHIWEWLRGTHALLSENKDGLLTTLETIRLGRLRPQTRHLVVNAFVKQALKQGHRGMLITRGSVDWAELNSVFKDRASALEMAEDRSRDISAKSRSILAWLGCFGRIPKRWDMLELDPTLVKALKPHFKWFMRLVNKAGGQRVTGHALIAAAKIAVVFGPNSINWVKDTQHRFDPSAVHDAGIEIDISIAGNKVLTDYIWKHRKHPEIVRLVKAAAYYKEWPRMGITLSMRIPEIIQRATAIRYSDIRSEATLIAVEAARWSYDQKDFTDLQEIWLHLKQAMPQRYDSIPDVEAREGDYRMYKLSKDDPRGLFLGEYTNCCQHPRNVGAYCAYHGQFSPDGAFYVIERYGQILVQSWVWRHKDIIIFDNAESIAKDGTYLPIIQSLYKKVAEQMIGKLSVKTVVLGLGYDDINAPQIEGATMVNTQDFGLNIIQNLEKQATTLTIHKVLKPVFVHIPYSSRIAWPYIYSDAKEQLMILARGESSVAEIKVDRWESQL